MCQRKQQSSQDELVLKMWHSAFMISTSVVTLYLICIEMCRGKLILFNKTGVTAVGGNKMHSVHILSKCLCARVLQTDELFW